MDDSTELSREPSQPEHSVAVEGQSVAPSRIHLAFALVAGLILIVVPLLLWVGPRQPKGSSPAASGSEMVPTAASQEQGDDGLEPESSVDKSSAVELGKVWIDKCEKPGLGKTPPEQCDRQPWFEEALVRAIQENSTCAPERAGTVSVVMRVDYRRRQVDVFSGKSGSIRGRGAAGLLACIKRSIPDPNWDSLEHEHTKYIIAVMATYPAKK